MSHFRKLIGAGVAASVLCGVGAVALAGAASANPVAVHWFQGCVGTYAKKLTLTATNEFTIPLGIIISGAASQITPTLAPGETKMYTVYTADTSKGAGHTSATVASAGPAELHGDLSASMSWTDHECGPAVTSTVPPTTAPTHDCAPGTKWVDNPPPAACYPVQTAPPTTLAPPAPEETVPAPTSSAAPTTTMPDTPVEAVKPSPKPKPTATPTTQAPTSTTAGMLPTTGSAATNALVALGFSCLLLGAMALFAGRRREPTA